MRDDELWEVLPRLVTNCARCGREGMKKKMAGLYTKDVSGSVRILCHLCPDCMDTLAEELGFSLP